MSCDDDKTRNLDAKLKLILQNAEKLTPENIAALKESLRVITEQAALLIKNPLRTLEEEQTLQKAIEAGKYISDFVIDTRLALQHRSIKETIPGYYGGIQKQAQRYSFAQQRNSHYSP